MYDSLRASCHNSIKRSLEKEYSTFNKKFPFPFMGVISSTLRKPQVNMDSVEAKFVRDAIANNKVTIFSKSYCPYCTMAKEVIKQNQKI